MPDNRPILNALAKPILEPRRVELKIPKRRMSPRILTQYWERPESWGGKAEDVPFPTGKIVDRGYKPSPQAWMFHTSPCRFRALAWGQRSGKTTAGAWETVRAALALPEQLHWVVGPTFKNLQQSETEVIRIVSRLGLEFTWRPSKHMLCLSHGAVIQFLAAEYPNTLRGPTITGSLWLEEVGYFRNEEAWFILRPRISIGNAGLWATSSPNFRNWFWVLCRELGLPPDGGYGEFEGKHSFVSHQPTWNFPYMPKSDLDAFRRKWPRPRFDKEMGAVFSSVQNRCFEFEKCLSLELPAREIQGATCMGVDLAQRQDFTAVIIMDAEGRIHKIDKWTGERWDKQIGKLISMAKQWNSVVVYDGSNIGGPVGEALDKALPKTIRVECNSPVIKSAMIEALQLSFEQQLIKLPDPSAVWAPKLATSLVEELDYYEPSLTRGGKLSYSAPKGLNDDLVIALALANWGRARGAVGGIAPAIVSIPASKWVERARKLGQDGESPPVMCKPGDYPKKRRKVSVPFRPYKRSMWDDTPGKMWR